MRQILVLVSLLFNLFYVTSDSDYCSKDGQSCSSGGNFIVGSYKDLLQDIGKYLELKIHIT